MCRPPRRQWIGVGSVVMSSRKEGWRTLLSLCQFLMVAVVDVF
jgi:hypothetical protein